VVVENNRFVDNTHGLYLEEAPQAHNATCTFSGNLIGGNDVGVALEPSVARAVFTANALVSNRVQVQLLGSRRSRADDNIWNGNYWSDYVGFDENGDGFGDTPHRVDQYFEDLAGRYPSAGLLRMGPAAEALELAARAFPIVKPQPAAVDEHPMVRPPAFQGEQASRRRTPVLLVAGVLLVGAAVFTMRRVGGEA
jgi:nitrous oxidase accessory protein